MISVFTHKIRKMIVITYRKLGNPDYTVIIFDAVGLNPESLPIILCLNWIDMLEFQ